MNGQSYSKYATPWPLPPLPKDSQRRGKPIRIKPSFQHYLGRDFEFNLYVGFMEHVVEKILPLEIIEAFNNASNLVQFNNVLQLLEKQLPILHWSTPSTSPGLIYINTLSTTRHTQGLGRFMSEYVSRWLLPGKLLPIFCTPSLKFHFIGGEKKSFFLQQIILEAPEDRDLAVIQINLPKLAREAKQIILSVQYARSVIGIKHLSQEQKLYALQELLPAALKQNEKEPEFEISIFEHAHQLLFKASSEAKANQIKEQILPLLHERPDIYTPDIFLDIQHFGLVIKDRFTAMRDIRHLARLIAFQYLFRKMLKSSVETSPKERHLACKLLKTKLSTPQGTRHVVGILIAINIFGENEVFDQKHFLEAILHCLPFVQTVKDSYIADPREHEQIRLAYWEIEKANGDPFKTEELQELRKRLPRELKASVENVTNSLFMPRNEEEVMRNILLLSQELKYVRDIPQVVISFDAQSEAELSFIIILARVLHHTTIALQDIFKNVETCIRFQDFECKEVGRIRKRYIKEVSVFTAKLDKKPFLRKDYSLDLFKARQTVAAELGRIVGDFRDFNGGILSKQQELLTELKGLLNSTQQSNEFLLENFFYSISPPLMQSLLPAQVLYHLYIMMLETLESDFNQTDTIISTGSSGEYFLLMCTSLNPEVKERVFAAIQKLNISSSDLYSTAVQTYDISCLGYMHRLNDNTIASLLEKTVRQTVKNCGESS